MVPSSEDLSHPQPAVMAFASLLCTFLDFLRHCSHAPHHIILSCLALLAKRPSSTTLVEDGSASIRGACTEKDDPMFPEIDPSSFHSFLSGTSRCDPAGELPLRSARDRRAPIRLFETFHASESALRLCSRANMIYCLQGFGDHIDMIITTKWWTANMRIACGIGERIRRK